MGSTKNRNSAPWWRAYNVFFSKAGNLNRTKSSTLVRVGLTTIIIHILVVTWAIQNKSPHWVKRLCVIGTTGTVRYASFTTCCLSAGRCRNLKSSSDMNYRSILHYGSTIDRALHQSAKISSSSTGLPGTTPLIVKTSIPSTVSKKLDLAPCD